MNALLQRKTRSVKAKVTKGDLDRIADFLKSMGAKVAAIDVTPDQVRIVTDAGRGLTLTGDEETLDAELVAHLARKNGQGGTQRRS